MKASIHQLNPNGAVIRRKTVIMGLGDRITITYTARDGNKVVVDVAPAELPDTDRPALYDEGR